MPVSRVAAAVVLALPLAACEEDRLSAALSASPAALKPTPIPSERSVWCDGFAQSGGLWNPSSIAGPVMVFQTWDATNSRYVSQYLDYSGQTDRDLLRGIVDPGEPKKETLVGKSWWWDYLRGRWPAHQAVRIVAGSSAQDERHPDSTIIIGLWTVAFQQETTSGTVTAERIFVLGGPSGQTLSAWVDGSGVTQQLSVGQYAQIETISGTAQLGVPVSIPALSTEADINGPAHFVAFINSDAANRHLPDGVP